MPEQSDKRTVAVVGGARGITAENVRGALDYFHDSADPFERLIHDGGQASAWATKWASENKLPVQGYATGLKTPQALGQQAARLIGKGQPAMVLYWEGGEKIAREAVAAGIQAINGETGEIMDVPDGPADSVANPQGAMELAQGAAEDAAQAAQEAQEALAKAEAHAEPNPAANPYAEVAEGARTAMWDEFGERAEDMITGASDAAGAFLEGLGKTDLAVLEVDEWRGLLAIVGATMLGGSMPAHE